MRHAKDEHQRPQHVRIAEARIAQVLLLGFSVLLNHSLHLRYYCPLTHAGNRDLVVQSGIDQGLITFRHGGEPGNQIGILERAIAACALRQGVSQAHDEMLMRIQELVTNLDLKKQVRPIQFSHWTRFLVFARLLKVDAVTGTIERHLALLAATLRTNPAMHSGAEALLLALFANRTTHGNQSPRKIMTETRVAPSGRGIERPGETPPDIQRKRRC